MTKEDLILQTVQATNADVADIKEDVATLKERSIGQDKRIGRIEKASGAVALALMVAFLSVFISGCGLFSFPTAPVDPEPAPPAPEVDVVQRAVDNTVALHTADEERRFCSGVVAEGAILTATHCVDDGIAFKIWYQGAMYEGVVVAMDDKTDLAIVAAVGARLKRTVPLGTKMPQLGNKVIWMGYPLAEDFIMGTGIVGNPRVAVGVADFMAVYGQFIPGNSGGPVFNYKGELVGIISMTMAYNGNYLPVGYSVPLDTIQTALTR